MTVRLLTPGQAMALLPNVPQVFLQDDLVDGLPSVNPAQLDRYMIPAYSLTIPKQPKVVPAIKVTIEADIGESVDYILHTDPLIAGAQNLLIKDQFGLGADSRSSIIPAVKVAQQLLIGARKLWGSDTQESRQLIKQEKSFLKRVARLIPNDPGMQKLTPKELRQIGSYAASLYRARQELAHRVGLYHLSNKDFFNSLRDIQEFIASIPEKFPESPRVKNLDELQAHLNMDPYDASIVLKLIHDDLKSENPLSAQFKNVEHYASYLLLLNYQSILGIEAKDGKLRRWVHNTLLNFTRIPLPPVSREMFSTLPKELIEAVLNKLGDKTAIRLLHQLFIGYPKEYSAFIRHVRMIGLKERLGRALNILRSRDLSKIMDAMAIGCMGLNLSILTDLVNSMDRARGFDEKSLSNWLSAVFSCSAISTIGLYVKYRQSIGDQPRFTDGAFLNVRNPYIATGVLAYGANFISALDDYMMGIPTKVPFEFVLIPLILFPIWLRMAHKGILAQEQLYSDKYGAYYKQFVSKSSRYWPAIKSPNKKSFSGGDQKGQQGGESNDSDDQDSKK